MHDPPCDTPQSHAIVRMFLLGCVAVHHLNHFFTSKADLEKGYPSLKDFQKAVSGRSFFHNTVQLIVHAIKCREVLPAAVSPNLSASVTTVTLTRRNDTRTKDVV
jgi:hypothetical protein